MALKNKWINIANDNEIPATGSDDETLIFTPTSVYKSTGDGLPFVKLYSIALSNNAVLLRNTGDTAISTNATITQTMEGKLHYVESLSDVTITIPADADENFEIGATISFTKENSGNVIIAGAAGVDVKAALYQFTLSTKYEIIHIRKKAANEWRVYGGDL